MFDRAQYEIREMGWYRSRNGYAQDISGTSELATSMTSIRHLQLVPTERNVVTKRVVIWKKNPARTSVESHRL